jgi:phosphoglycolate phosphatase
LFLFDIDGTLIRRAGPHHRMALVAAVRRVTGLHAPLDHIPVQGMLDPKILETMMLDAGASASLIRRSLPAILKEAQSIYLRICPRDLRAAVCPGVRPALSRLRRRGIPAGLVTGNLSRIAWRKMRSAGLRRYLRFGAFSESAPERAGLVRIALRHARRLGCARPDTRVWLVGDHPNDILAAQANHVGSIAVATGLASREELAALAPDFILDDLRSLPWPAFLS